MSVNFYGEFARFLKASRERSGKSLEDISRATRINRAYVELMENGVFDFASSVLIQGYLRKYAQAIGLNPDALSRQYNLILRKIEYVSSSQHLPPEFIKEPSPPKVKTNWPTVSIWKKAWWEHYARLFNDRSDEYRIEVSPSEGIADDTQTVRLQSTTQALDEEVLKKWKAERRVTSLVSFAAFILILISAVFFITNPQASGPWQTDDETAYSDGKKIPDASLQRSPTGLKRVKLEMTEPLYIYPQRVNPSAVLEWLARDSARAFANQKSQKLKKGESLTPISVHDITKYDAE